MSQPATAGAAAAAADDEPIDETYLDLNDVGGAAAAGIDLRKELLDDTYMSAQHVVNDAGVTVLGEETALPGEPIHATAIRKYHEHGALDLLAVRSDPSLALLNGPGRPSWYEQCAKQALEAISIDNVVVVAYLNGAIQCPDVVARAAFYGMKQNPSTFAAIIQRQLNPLGDVVDPELPAPQSQPPPGSAPSVDYRQQVSSTSLIFPGGKITTTGAPTFASGVMATKRSVDVIANVRDDYGRLLYPGLAIRLIMRKNVVASTALFFQLRIDEMQRKYPSFVTSVPDKWVGVNIEMKSLAPEYADRTLTVLVFAVGSLVFTATHGRADVERCFRIIYPILVEFAVPNTEVSRANLLDKKKASKRDATAAAAARAAAAAVAKPDIQPSVAVALVTANAPRPDNSLVPATATTTAVAVAKRPSKRKEAPDAIVVARNELAFSTMEQHLDEKTQQQIETAKRRAETLARVRTGSAQEALKAAEFDKRRRLISGLRTKQIDQAEALELAHEMQQ
jgi:TATA-box binding protein (TBP) (component of TFIID and TFIIIB)